MRTKERSSGAGFTDWNKKARELGMAQLAELMGNMDSHTTIPGANAHRSIAQELAELGLPVQTYVSPTLQEFTDSPDKYLAEIPEGDYYFASIAPGAHLAHAKTPQEVVRFTNEHLALYPDKQSLDTELYVSHNGMPVMSGHVIVHDDAAPNTIHAEFTIGNFNDFHRGFTSPDLVMRRVFSRFTWEYRDNLEGIDEHEKVLCNGDILLTRHQVAHRALAAVEMIPRDEDYYMPGYYEVLLERRGRTATRAAFIDANLGYRTMLGQSWS